MTRNIIRTGILRTGDASRRHRIDRAGDRREPRRGSRITAAAASVGIVAGVVFIVAVVFFSGFILGKASDSGGHRGGPGHGDRVMMHHGGPPPMMGPGRPGAGRPVRSRRSRAAAAGRPGCADDHRPGPAVTHLILTRSRLRAYSMV